VSITFEILLSVGSTVSGVVLTIIYETVRENLRFRKELKQNSKIDLSGSDWFAAWQTSVDQKELINTEEIIIEQKGALIKIHNREKSRENPKGGYKWEGQLRFYHGRDLMGHYFARPEEQNTNKGIMYFCYVSAKKQFIGSWVGASYDGPLLTGFVVISKHKTESVELLKQIIKSHPDKVPIISYSM
jgi:hypothetical protein